MYPTPELKKQLTEQQQKTAAEYAFQPGNFFMGFAFDKDKNPVEIGIPSKKHAITIAGSRSGKGAGIIMPNLFRWPDNAIVIDPKGEAAEETAAAREAMGQDVHVIDPFQVAKVPDRFKGFWNPLAELQPAARTIREDINVLTDGTVIKYDARAGHWDGGAASLISGLIAFVITTADEEHRTLPKIRQLLTLPPDHFAKFVDELARNNACGNLPATAAGKLQKSGSEAGHFLSNADENTKWLDSVPMQEVLSKSTFRMTDLKAKPTTIYLVLPADELSEHGRFLRLFVRSALRAMAKGGKEGHQCLFLLDEFFSLGRIDEIAKSAGLMPGYGVRLWPILQDLNQLVQMYGRDGAGTFFGNADLHQFFGNTDSETLDYVANRIGAKTVDETPIPPAAPMMSQGGGGSMVAGLLSGRRGEFSGVANFIGGSLDGLASMGNAFAQADYQNEMNAYNREMSKVGKPRIPADQVAALVQLKTDRIADGAISFLYGSETVYHHLAPYFRDLPVPPPVIPLSARIRTALGFAAPKTSTPEPYWSKSRLGRGAVGFGIGFLLGFMKTADVGIALLAGAFFALVWAMVKRKWYA